MPGTIETALIGLVILAGWKDLRTRRIPNYLTLPGALLGIALQAWYGGLHGALTALAGAVLGFGIFVGLYLAGGMGAGDVKLFSAVGAFAGPQTLIIVFVFTGLVGGISAVVLAASRGRLRETLERTRTLLFDLGRLRLNEVRCLSSNPQALRLPYGVVIAGGTLLSLVALH